MFLKFDMRQGALVTRQGHKSHSDMRHEHFLNSTGDMGINKRQRHSTLAFLKIDRRHGHPPSRAPNLTTLLFSLTMPCTNIYIYIYMSIISIYICIYISICICIYISI